MEFTGLVAVLLDWVPSVLTLLFFVGGLWALRYVLFVKRPASGGEANTLRQLLMLVLTAMGIVAVLLAMPVGHTLRGQILTFLGILFTAAITLSSTTFLGNAMAGLMLRAVRNFRPGDFLEVEEHFGRVSEHGLLHTEIQTIDRTLTTIPNQYLITHPVTVVRASGTVVSATVSLGYDVPRQDVERCLLAAAEKAELTDPFVLVVDLGDFSVTYRVGGLLEGVKTLLTARSQLRCRMLDSLHENRIEIVSPTFMNQRVFREDRAFIPRSKRQAVEKRKPLDEESLESKVFDKADDAEVHAQLKTELDALSTQIAELEAKLEKSEDEAAKLQSDIELKRLQARRLEVEAEIQAKKEAIDSPD